MSLEKMTEKLHVCDLGKISYGEALALQQGLVELRMREAIPDTLLFAQHDPTITFGLDEKWNVLHVGKEELRKQKIKFYPKTPRGGGAAYLGPGQLVGYIIMDIAKYGGVLSFLRMLEEVMIDTGNAFSIPIERHEELNPTTEKMYRATWYVNGAKYVLCTKGIGVRYVNGDEGKNGMISHHGFSLYVNKEEPSYFHLIDPCGFPIKDVKPISMEEITGKKIPYEKVKEQLVKNFEKITQKKAQYTEVGKWSS